MPDLLHVHWLAVVIAAVAGVVIGFVWYMPAVFGRRWATEGGFELPTSQTSPIVYVMSVVQALLTAYVIGLFAGGAGIVNGAVIGLLFWVVVAAVTYSIVLYERRSVTYWAISAGYWLVTLLVMGAIAGYFPSTM
jgi:hypothetical protein